MGNKVSVWPLQEMEKEGSHSIHRTEPVNSGQQGTEDAEHLWWHHSIALLPHSFTAALDAGNWMLHP